MPSANSATETAGPENGETSGYCREATPQKVTEVSPLLGAKATSRQSLAAGGPLSSVLAKRVASNCRKVDTAQFDREQRVAYRYLFSSLAHFEEVAVCQAFGTHGAPGQLQDEIVHQRTFQRLAESLGGIVPTPPAAAALISYVHSLSGRLAVEATNLLAEVWISTLFSYLSRVTALARLLRGIEADEHRHTAYAKQFSRPTAFADVAREMEARLVALTATPTFILPLIFTLGFEDAARLGLALLEQHTLALAARGVSPGPYLRRVKRQCRAALATGRNRPEPIPMTQWDHDRQELAFLGTMDGDFTVALSRVSHPRLEARVVRAVAAALARVPEAHRTLRCRALYQPNQICIGVRRLHAPTGSPITVYIVRPHLVSERRVMRAIARKHRVLNAQPYVSRALPNDLIDLMPPAKCAIAVTFVGGRARNVRRILGGGYAPLIDGEGCAGSVTIGTQASGSVRLGFRMDHRHFDGDVMIRFMEAVAASLGASL